MGKGATSTEYVILLVVILLIVIMSSTLLNFFPAYLQAEKAKGSAAYWSSAQPFAVSETKNTGSGSLLLVLQNEGDMTRKLKGVKLTSGQNSYTHEFLATNVFKPGQRRSVSVDIPQTGTNSWTYDDVCFIFDAGDATNLIQCGKKSFTGEAGTAGGSPQGAGCTGDGDCISPATCQGSVCVIDSGACGNDNECASGNCGENGFCTDLEPGSCDPMCKVGSPTVFCSETISGCTNWTDTHPYCTVTSDCNGFYGLCSSSCSGTCRGTGEACTLPNECCSGLTCTSGVCAGTTCVGAGESCASTSCCSGLTCNASSVCVADTCYTYGEACTTTGCCSGYSCTSSICCRESGCTLDAQCCAATPYCKSSTHNCENYGETYYPCGLDSDCRAETCYSSYCICMANGICTSNDDCCSGSCSYNATSGTYKCGGVSCGVVSGSWCPDSYGEISIECTAYCGSLNVCDTGDCCKANNETCSSGPDCCSESCDGTCQCVGYGVACTTYSDCCDPEEHDCDSETYECCNGIGHECNIMAWEYENGTIGIGPPCCSQYYCDDNNDCMLQLIPIPP